MHRSFAQFSRFLCVTVGAFALQAALSAPLQAQTAATPELLAAQQAVNRADQADADQYAPDLLASARSALAQAQAAAASRRDRRLAPELALRASVDADLARARSNEATANAQLAQRKQEVEQLQRTLGTELAP
ncbi:MAG: DUF4398 domain-containing protein [Lysobacteraceae bacterium]|jgi:hypothetical protein|nr:MAG: DUF4398 domain-containing protein [Xanthomonadaceae bacterium]